jgi:O-antigen ligase
MISRTSNADGGHQHEDVVMGIEISGLLGLILLICVIYAIVKTAQSRAPTSTKVIWIVVLLLLPVIGFILWLLLGPK